MKKKFLIALWATLLLAGSTFATGEVAPAATPTKPANDPAKTVAIITCIRNAALTREWYLQKYYSDYSSAIGVAYVHRSTAISKAYETGKTMKEIRPMIQAGFDTWRTTIKQTRATLIKNRKDTWETYKNDVKACRPDKSTSQAARSDAASQQTFENDSF